MKVLAHNFSNRVSPSLRLADLLLVFQNTMTTVMHRMNI